MELCKKIELNNSINMEELKNQIQKYNQENEKDKLKEKIENSEKDLSKYIHSKEQILKYWNSQDSKLIFLNLLKIAYEDHCLELNPIGILNNCLPNNISPKSKDSLIYDIISDISLLSERISKVVQHYQEKNNYYLIKYDNCLREKGIRIS